MFSFYRLFCCSAESCALLWLIIVTVGYSFGLSRRWHCICFPSCFIVVIYNLYVSPSSGGVLGWRQFSRQDVGRGRLSPHTPCVSCPFWTLSVKVVCTLLAYLGSMGGTRQHLRSDGTPPRTHGVSQPLPRGGTHARPTPLGVGRR